MATSMNIASILAPRIEALNSHPVYAALETPRDLRCFMEHHVYSVWDFMSLVKYLQATLAPSRHPWRPLGDPSCRRFINELVLEEESDRAWPGDEDSGFCSHFELYLDAMAEVGADPSRVQAFVARSAAEPMAFLLENADIPEPSRRFTATTFGFIDGARPHEAAAALAVGREHVIPTVFRAILARFGIDAGQAPRFHYYLNRHVHLDEDFHAPMSIRLMTSLCGDDTVAQQQAVAAAGRALDARVAFWDGVLEAMPARTARA